MQKQDWARILNWDLAVLASHALLLSVIMSVGGVIQDMVDALLFGSQANLIDSAYEGGVAIGAGALSNWAMSPHILTLLLPCLLVLLITSKQTDSTHKNLTMFAGLYAVLCTSDTLIRLVYKDVDFGSLTTHYIYNFFGTIAILIIYKIILLANHQLQCLVNVGQSSYSRLIEILIVVASSLLYLILMFVIYTSTMTVAPSHVSITLSPPFDFFYDSDMHDGFDISIEKNKHKTIDWRFFSTDISINYQINDSVQTDLEVRILNSCGFSPTTEEIKKTLTQPPVFSLDGISNTSLWIDDGQIDMKLINDNVVNSHLNLNADGLSQVNISQDGEEYRISKFISDGATVNHNNWGGTTSYAFFLSDFLPKNDTPIRHVKISSENLDKEFKFSFPRLTQDKQSEVSCVNVPLNDGNNYAMTTSIAGLVLTFTTNQRQISWTNQEGENNTTIKGLNGWVYKDSVSENDLKKVINSGHLNFLVGSASIKSLQVDGKPFTVHDIHGIAIRDGEIYASRTSNGTIRIIGDAGVFFFENNRVSRSRWEKLGTEYQIAILTVLLSIIVFSLSQLLKQAVNSQTNKEEKAE